jgi:hypothetical protein
MNHGQRNRCRFLLSYEGLEGQYAHKVVDHAVEYVNGSVHTNSLENFWSLLKRTISGTYVSVEPFHLFRYLDEQAFRFNERTHAYGRSAVRCSCLQDRRQEAHVGCADGQGSGTHLPQTVICSGGGKRHVGYDSNS